MKDRMSVTWLGICLTGKTRGLGIRNSHARQSGKGFTPRRHNMSYVLLLSLVLIAIPFLLSWWSSKNDPLNAIPLAPDHVPIFGHTKAVLSSQPGVMERKWSRLLPFGIFRTYFFTKSRVTITDPKALAKVLVTSAYDYPKPEPTQHLLTALLGDGLLIAEGVIYWKIDFSIPSSQKNSGHFSNKNRFQIFISTEEIRPGAQKAEESFGCCFLGPKNKRSDLYILGTCLRVDQKMERRSEKNISSRRTRNRKTPQKAPKNNNKYWLVVDSLVNRHDHD